MSVAIEENVVGELIEQLYRADNPQNPHIFRRGEVASAEPTVLGWSVPVDELFA